MHHIQHMKRGEQNTEFAARIHCTEFIKPRCPSSPYQRTCQSSAWCRAVGQYAEQQSDQPVTHDNSYTATAVYQQ